MHVGPGWGLGFRPSSRSNNSQLRLAGTKIDSAEATDHAELVLFPGRIELEGEAKSG